MPTSANGFRYPSLSDAPNVPQNFANLVADLESMVGGVWSTYTPAWTATGTAPSLGNGTIAGQYRRIGTLLVGHIDLTMGSTTTYGSGAYAWSIPAGNELPTRALTLGIGVVTDTSANQYFAGVAGRTSISTIHLRMHGASLAGPAVPVTLASTDNIRLMYVTEVSP